MKAGHSSKRDKYLKINNSDKFNDLQTANIKLPKCTRGNFF